MANSGKDTNGSQCAPLSLPLLFCALRLLLLRAHALTLSQEEGCLHSPLCSACLRACMAHVTPTATVLLMGDAGFSSALLPRPGLMAGERPRLSQYHAHP